jgi:hypothetical protein
MGIERAWRGKGRKTHSIIRALAQLLAHELGLPFLAGPALLVLDAGDDEGHFCRLR